MNLFSSEFFGFRHLNNVFSVKQQYDALFAVSNTFLIGKKTLKITPKRAVVMIKAAI